MEPCAGRTGTYQPRRNTGRSMVVARLFGGVRFDTGLFGLCAAAEVGTHAYVNPFVAVFLGSVFGGEHITWLQITGLVVILCGVVFISRQAKT